MFAGDPEREAVQRLWTCGFQPGGAPKDYASGLADTFEEARDQWQAAWEVYLPRRTEIDFEEWRQHHRFMADKLAGRLPPSPPANIMEWACGTTFDSHVAAEVRERAGHIYRVHATKVETPRTLARKWYLAARLDDASRSAEGFFARGRGRCNAATCANYARPKTLTSSRRPLPILVHGGD